MIKCENPDSDKFLHPTGSLLFKRDLRRIVFPKIEIFYFITKRYKIEKKRKKKSKGSIKILILCSSKETWKELSFQKLKYFILSPNDPKLKKKEKEK